MNQRGKDTDDVVSSVVQPLEMNTNYSIMATAGAMTEDSTTKKRKINRMEMDKIEKEMNRSTSLMDDVLQLPSASMILHYFQLACLVKLNPSTIN